MSVVPAQLNIPLGFQFRENPKKARSIIVTQGNLTRSAAIRDTSKLPEKCQTPLKADPNVNKCGQPFKAKTIKTNPAITKADKTETKLPTDKPVKAKQVTIPVKKSEESDFKATQVETTPEKARTPKDAFQERMKEMEAQRAQFAASQSTAKASKKSTTSQANPRTDKSNSTDLNEFPSDKASKMRVHKNSGAKGLSDSQEVKRAQSKYADMKFEDIGKRLFEAWPKLITQLSEEGFLENPINLMKYISGCRLAFAEITYRTGFDNNITIGEADTKIAEKLKADNKGELPRRYNFGPDNFTGFYSFMDKISSAIREAKTEYIAKHKKA